MKDVEQLELTGVASDLFDNAHLDIWANDRADDRGAKKIAVIRNLHQVAQAFWHSVDRDVLRDFDKLFLKATISVLPGMLNLQAYWYVYMMGVHVRRRATGSRAARNASR